MQKLTNKEEEIMHILWKLKKAFVKDIMEEITDDKPHYNTLSTIVRNLEEKGYVIKEPNKDDKRSSIIKLTEKGQSLIRDEESIFIQFETNMQKLLTEDELIQLDHLLYKLSRGIADDN